MIAVDLDELELERVGHNDVEGAKWGVSFPFSADRPGTTVEAFSSGSVVYNEIEPGAHIGTHRGGDDEFVLVLEGTVKATVAGESMVAESTQLLVVPAGTDHTVENVGDETARVLGFFGDGTVASDFADPVEQIGDG